MNENLKKRIIGVVIIGSISAIVAPMLFKGSGQKDLKYISIEDPKDIEFKYIGKAEKLNNENNKQVKKLDIRSSARIIKDVKDLKDVLNKSNNMSWVIRVGTFSEKNNAQNLIKKLQSLGFRSFIITINKDTKILYAVNVGPFFKPITTKKMYSELIKNKDFKNSYIIESDLKK